MQRKWLRLAEEIWASKTLEARVFLQHPYFAHEDVPYALRESSSTRQDRFDDDATMNFIEGVELERLIGAGAFGEVSCIRFFKMRNSLTPCNLTKTGLRCAMERC
jgi:hypothetical protein